jgi:alcohol dehydrogenase, propanol-preferring
VNRAWLFCGTGRPLELVDRPAPTPGPRQVVIEVRAAGLCHSDIGIIDGPGAGWISQCPIVLGHEVAGVVRELGSDVDAVRVGDRVAVAVPTQPIHRGWRPPANLPGLGRDGGYGHRVTVDIDLVVPVPDEVSFAQAAVATDSVTTAFHAVGEVGRVRPADVVAIIGLGGLGLNAMHFAALAGATVLGVDLSAAARDRAVAAGVATIYEQIDSLEPHRPDVVFDFAGFGVTTAKALEVVRPGGSVVVVGLGEAEATISTNLLVTKGIRVLGSLGGTKQDLIAVLDMIADGRLVPVVEEIGFDDIPAGLDRLRAGQLVGRLAAILND